MLALPALLHRIESWTLDYLRRVDIREWNYDNRRRVEQTVLARLKFLAQREPELPTAARAVLAEARIEIDVVDGQPHLFVFWRDKTLEEALSPHWPSDSNDDYGITFTLWEPEGS